MTGPPQDRTGPRSVAALATEVSGLRHDVASLTTRADELARTQHKHAAAFDSIPELRRQVEKILDLKRAHCAGDQTKAERPQQLHVV